ncbi:restriction endonuclease subunit S [Pelotomaculum isophthalicicum JI]|uniref:Restriction endonuclease subunit S n=1 Tax=Pelotomaculum isophthalicicum JI TaxID=947010 RepID=A0A9X4H6W6_9FIRM|nr:restriction endonuclease subunit S [Pelotomaculum isophthalicicum]MDF9408819.1 restriction endonuclease subunit S [Pelotomaculum isophthalicicum JI]
MTWEKIKLKKILSQPIQNGYSPVCPEAPNGKWILGLGALNGTSLDINEKKPAPLNDEKVDNFLLRSGDFLVSRSNTLDKVGRSALFKGEIENCSYPDLMMRFRIDSSKVFPEFLEHYLKGFDATLHFQRSASGTSGSMVKINKGVLENLLVPLPPITEQKKIAGILKLWQEAIEKIERLITAKEKQFHWLLFKCLTGKLRINRTPKKWNNVTFGEVFQQYKIVNEHNENLDVLSVTRNGIVHQSDYFNKEIASEDKSKYLIAERGTLVMSGLNFWMGSIDFQTICDVGIVSPAYKVFRIINSTVNVEYIRFFVRSPLMTRMLINSSVQGASIVRRNLDMDYLNESPILLPSIEEQKGIAEILRIAEKELQLQRILLDSYRRQKRGLMQKLLTGKWRVKTGEGIES